MSNVMLMTVAVAYESEIAGPFVAQKVFVISSKEDFVAQFAEFAGFRDKFETDSFRVVQAVVSKVDVVDGFAVTLIKEEDLLAPDPNVVPFTRDAVQEYLDVCIRHARQERDSDGKDSEMYAYYVDAYQSIRTSLFDELLPEEDINGRSDTK